MMSDIQEKEVKHTWEMISQFVCWEYCRNTNLNGNICDPEKQADLMQFFRDIVIKMTTKKYEKDITSHEISAKFIEELGMLVMSSQPQERIGYITKLSDSLKRLCPQLKSSISDLLSTIYLKLYVMKESGATSLAKDAQLWKDIKTFSVKVHQCLSVPELLKATSSWKPSANNTNLKDAVLARLKKEKISRSEITKIQKSIENDVLLRMYYDEVSYVPPESEKQNSSEVGHASNAPQKTATSSKKTKNTSPKKTKKGKGKSKKTKKRYVSGSPQSDPDSSDTTEVAESPVKLTSNRILRRISEDSDEDSEEEIQIVKEVYNSVYKNAMVQLKRIKVEDTTEAEERGSVGIFNKSHPQRAPYQPVPVNEIKTECHDIFTSEKRSRIKSHSKKKK